MKKHIKDRRERLRELGKIDTANRCAYCRRALKHGHVTVLDVDGSERKFCDDACRIDHRNLLEVRR